MGIGAEGTAAISDDLLIGREVGHAFLKLVERDRLGPFDVTGVELLGGANVDQDHVAAA
jgi:hypothetical protein